MPCIWCSRATVGRDNLESSHAAMHCSLQERAAMKIELPFIRVSLRVLMIIAATQTSA